MAESYLDDALMRILDAHILSSSSPVPPSTLELLSPAVTIMVTPPTPPATTRPNSPLAAAAAAAATISESPSPVVLKISLSPLPHNTPRALKKMLNYDERFLAPPSRAPSPRKRLNSSSPSRPEMLSGRKLVQYEDKERRHYPSSPEKKRTVQETGWDSPTPRSKYALYSDRLGSDKDVMTKELFPEKMKKSPEPDKGKKEMSYPSLKAMVIPKRDNKEETVCYNCAKKGHSFMDCVNGCGRCGKPGHRTIDCNIVRK